MSKTPTQFTTFTLERVYPAPRSRVFAAWAEIEAKTRWFAGEDQWTIKERAMQFRPGGRERVVGRWPNGRESAFDAVYFDIVPDERIVYAYEMHVDGARISVSVATVELEPAGTGTRLRFTEQAAFVNGYDDAGSREQGTNHLLDKLGKSLGS